MCQLLGRNFAGQAATGYRKEVEVFPNYLVTVERTSMGSKASIAVKQ